MGCEYNVVIQSITKENQLGVREKRQLVPLIQNFENTS